jgi:hypothetical protein
MVTAIAILILPVSRSRCFVCAGLAMPAWSSDLHVDEICSGRVLGVLQRERQYISYLASLRHWSSWQKAPTYDTHMTNIGFTL